jgi:hypothetical protein
MKNLKMGHTFTFNNHTRKKKSNLHGNFIKDNEQSSLKR